MKTLLVMDIGGTHIKCGAMKNGVPSIVPQHALTRSVINNDPIGELAKQIERACQLLNIDRQYLDAVVATIPGLLAPDLNQVLFSGNIPQLNGRYLATELSAQLQLPVYLERDVILLLQGEWLKGAGKDTQHVLGIFFGTGVGAACLDNGRPFRGNGFALEIGHIPFKGNGHSLQRPEFKPHCLENYVSGRVLEAIAARHTTLISDLFVSAINNPVLAEEINNFITDMAMATASLMTLFSPQRTIVGGGICHMCGFPYDRFRQQVMALLPITRSDATLNLCRDELGWQAVLHGAAVRLGWHTW